MNIFSTRNAYYLRISPYRTVPLFLYLDERHVDWMQDRILQIVIASLQSKLSDLLLNARNEKNYKVHVERGEGYQFCYFLRSTTRTEVILLKRKTINLRPCSPTIMAMPEAQPSNRPKRKANSSTTPNAKTFRRPGSSRSRSRSMRPDYIEQLDKNEVGEKLVETSPPREGLKDVEVKAELDTDLDLEMTDEKDEFRGQGNIKDWKPDIDVSYQGFPTSSIQLVLIIEPYPPLPSKQWAPPMSRLSSRSTSVSNNRARSSATTRDRSGRGADERYSNVEPSATPLGFGTGLSEERTMRRETNVANMRNASRAPSAYPNSRFGGSVVPFAREDSSTPIPNDSIEGRRRMSQTPLFMPRDTPFDEDEEDEEAHIDYLSALSLGWPNLPGTTHPAGSQPRHRQRSDSVILEEEEEDMPESIVGMSERLMRNSEIEKGVVRVQGGWEERGEGEDSAVMGNEESGRNW
ncbi:uncharacterized protein L203_100313 [Cryptococcus depauperatus CBS 7841]|uniref:Uncharacterized protein n=1 Tax=Cryptococcus depauperatus CBS 7841 TaxID=1295531 RepID=A0AAJ8LXK2_9TREE